MALLDNLFSKKPLGKPADVQDAGPTDLSEADEQALDRKSQRLERRELLYAVVRESMARVGMLSSTYKYKVLSLDSRGSQYLIMMDLPKEMVEHIVELARVEETITQTARMRHKIDVTAVYWRINELSKSALLRKPRAEAEPAPHPSQTAERPAPAPQPAGAQRFEPIRPDEVHAFKSALAAGSRATPAVPARKLGQAGKFATTEFATTEFEATRLQGDDHERMPLSRTQYGDLI